MFVTLTDCQVDVEKNIVTFIDDCSKYTYIYQVNTKDEVFQKFEAFKSEVEIHLEYEITRIRQMRWRIYMNRVQLFCEKIQYT